MSDETTSPQDRPGSGKSRPELSVKPADKRPLIIGIIAAIAILFIFVGSGVILFYNPAETAVLRDIFIIYLGFGVFVIILLLIALIVITAYLVLKVNDLVQLLDREVRPVLGRLQQTTRSISGTATFISDKAVQPIISTASMIAAIRAIFRALFKRN